MPVGVDEPRALAADERDVGARVGRQQRACAASAVGSRDHRRRADLAPRRRRARRATAARSFGTIPPLELARVEHPLGLVAADRRRDRAAEQHARERR